MMLDEQKKSDETAHQEMERYRRLTTEAKHKQVERFLVAKPQHKKVQRFTDEYKLIKTLGSGAFGTVKLAKHKATETQCAVKIIKKDSLKVAKVYEELL